MSVQRSTRDNLVGSLSIATEAQGGNLPPGKPLLSEVRGGARRAKRSEVLLQRAGVLPAGWLTVPGRGARLDAYGNLQRGQLLQILAFFRTYGAATRSGKASLNGSSPVSGLPAARAASAAACRLCCGVAIMRTSARASRGSPGLTDSPCPLSSTARTGGGKSMP